MSSIHADHNFQVMMPAVNKSPYDKLKKSELKALLLQRDEFITSQQSTWGLRLKDSDDLHTVSQGNGLGFLDLSGEIRNEIYKLVADYAIQRNDSRARTALYFKDGWDWKKDRRLTHRGDPQLEILQPGLFITCRQIRTEGLPFFYQRREFYLPLNHGQRILDLYWYQAGFSRWFQAIGDVGQQNIRHLTLHNASTMRGIDSFERIHRKLSDEATVVYKTHTTPFARALWQIMVRYQAKNKKKVPSFGYEENGSLVKVSKLPELGIWALCICILKFEAGSGWFGMAQDDRAQIWWRRDERIEKWNQELLAADEESRRDMYEVRKEGSAMVASGESGHR